MFLIKILILLNYLQVVTLTTTYELVTDLQNLIFIHIELKKNQLPMPLLSFHCTVIYVKRGCNCCADKSHQKPT